MNPFISVIIPVYNDPDGLNDTVNALLCQDYPIDHYEIIIVDNGSSDNTFRLACDFAEKFPCRIKSLQESKLIGSYAARNKGVAAATGEIFCFIDADVTMDKTYLSMIAKKFNDDNVDYLGCRVEVNSKHDTLSAKYELLRAFPVKGYIDNRHYAPTCCLSVRKRVIDKAGLFNQKLESGGDMEFGRRVHEAGIAQSYADHIFVCHPARWSYGALIHKAQRCARGYAQLYHHDPETYAEDYKETFSLHKFIPRKPFKLQKCYLEKGIVINLWEALLLAMFHIPLKVCAATEQIRETLRLRQAENSVQPSKSL